jgi:POT family proton-dependent oligopeptide transporter
MLLSIAIYLAGARHLPAEPRSLERDQRVKLQPGDARAVRALLATLLITSLYWVAQTQVWNTYALWIRDRVDRSLFGFNIPVTWFQSIDFVAVVGMAPVTLWFWRRQARRAREPDDLTKVTMGCAFFAVSCAWLSASEIVSGSGHVALLWPLVFHLMGAFAYLYASPIMLGSGWLGRFYERMSAQGFWFLHAAIAGAGAVLLLLLRRPLRTALRLQPT